MASRLTLDAIRQATEVKYAPFIVDLDEERAVELRQALRLPKDERRRVGELQKQLDDIDQASETAEDEMVQTLGDLLRLVAADKALVEDLLLEVGDDVAFLMGVLEAYGKSTQLPEA